MRLIVVGATGTIGSAVAAALEARHEVLRASRGSALSVDITDAASIRAMYARTGPVDGVISCAGHAVMKPLLELEDADYEASLAGKLMGQVNLVREGIEHVRDGGVFILTAGIFSQTPIDGVPALALVNGALEAFARGAARDLPRGLRIHTVSPPFIDVTARKMGVPGGITAEENAVPYVELVEGTSTGTVVFAGKSLPVP